MSKKAKLAGEAETNIVTDLENQIIVGVTPSEWELSTIVDYYEEKEDTLERRNYRGPKLTDTLRIVKRAIEKLIRQQVDTDKMQFSLMPGL